MNNVTKSLALAAALSTAIATSALALHWNGNQRRTEAIEGLIVELKSAREAAPVLREAPYGETVDGAAWQHYTLALECVSAIDDYRDRCRALAEAETEGERAAGKVLLGETGDLLGHLKRGAHARDATRTLDWNANLSARTLRLADSRAMGQLVQAHAYRLVVEGRSVEAVQAMLDMQQFAADTMMSPSLIEEMIGCALIAPDRFKCTPAPGGPELSAEAKHVWLDGIRKIKSTLPHAGRSYEGELELLARYLHEPNGRAEEDWDDDTPGLRYGFSWETAAAEFALDMHERSPAYHAAMESPDGIERLMEMQESIKSEGNPAAERCGQRLSGAAVSRRTAIMRIGLLEHALAIELGAESTAPTHPQGDPVTVESVEEFVRVGSKDRHGRGIRFDLLR